jgi:hypothetical protein
MAKKTSSFTIKAAELAAALEVSLERLDEVIAFFDSDPNDEWELKENDHFIYINKTWKERLFSQQGAFAIAKYMDSIEEKSFWDKLVEFVTKHKAKLRNAFIRQKVLENCSSLTKRNDRHFLSKKDVVNILCTSFTKVNSAFEEIKHSGDPMIICEDFDDIEGVRYYSLSGLSKLCRHLADEGVGLKSIDRREWCAGVKVVGNKTLKLLIDAEEAKKKKIQAAMDAARKRDKNCCQITHQTPTKYNKFNLAVHHIFSRNHYPHLAVSLDNLITMTEQVHQEFHGWNGGFDKACTIDDLIQFINEQYSENDEICIRLSQVKKTLGEQKVA